MKRVFIGRVEIKSFGDIPGFLFLSHKTPLCSLIDDVLSGYSRTDVRCKVTLGRARAIEMKGPVHSFLQVENKDTRRGNLPVQELRVGSTDLFDLLARNEGKSCRMELEVG